MPWDRINTLEKLIEYWTYKGQYIITLNNNEVDSETDLTVLSMPNKN